MTYPNFFYQIVWNLSVACHTIWPADTLGHRSLGQVSLSRPAQARLWQTKSDKNNLVKFCLITFNKGDNDKAKISTCITLTLKLMLMLIPNHYFRLSKVFQTSLKIIFRPNLDRFQILLISCFDTKKSFFWILKFSDSV